MTEEPLFIADRDSFRDWLAGNAAHDGVWLLFYKKKGVQAFTAAQALEEALCFGWIDGQIESLGDDRYKKYFAPRRASSQWSEKNRKLVETLIAAGKMTPVGLAKIEESKRRGTYEGVPRAAITEAQVDALRQALQPHDTALANFEKMTPSARRAYTGGYFAIKTEDGRKKKLAQLVERLNLNLNPMESLAKKRMAE